MATDRDALGGVGPTPAQPEGALERAPRVAMIAESTRLMVHAGVVGDVEAARVAHDAIGRLMGLPSDLGNFVRAWPRVVVAADFACAGDRRP